MDYISSRQAAAKWDVSLRNVQRLLTENRVRGAKKIGSGWLIPADAEKPTDPRRAKTSPPPYLPYIVLSSVIPMPYDNADAVLDTLNGDMRAQYSAELAYLRGDFAYSTSYFNTVPIASPVYLCACVNSMAAAIGGGDYTAYLAASASLERLKSKYRSFPAEPLIEAALITMPLSLFHTEHIPEWLKKCDFSSFTLEAKPWALYLHIKYLQGTKQYARAEAAAEVAMAVYSRKDGFTLLDIYFRFIRASACFGMGDPNKGRKWLAEALELTLPRGFLTPVAESVMSFGGELEKYVSGRWQDKLAVISARAESAWRHWRRFHNQFAKDNITMVLTMQEYRLAQHFVNGCSYAETARRMDISLGRVKDLASLVYAKLYISSKGELNKYII